MKVSMNLYGEQAKTLAKELGLQCTRKSADVPMTAHFTYRDVEGHTVIAVEFTSTETAQKIEKTPEQTKKESLELEAEAAQLRAELKAFMEVQA
jgi:hypothetical protein